MTDKDKDFLRDLSKRLVHKYGEHTSILDQTYAIIDQISNYENKTDNNYKIISQTIKSSINQLVQLVSKLDAPKSDDSTKNTEFYNNKQSYTKDFFDRINVDDLLKGKNDKK